jgi:phosphohistidine phosphatase SixA/8-oxo-dGTP pyrophosphatase MutT (NUDIX family)
VTSKSPIRAGGVVLLRETPKGRQTLLVHRPRHKDWSLPKGKVDRGESILESAVRECREESGIQPILGPPLGRQRYQVLGRPKTVDYWLARVGRDHGFKRNDEVDKIRWVNQDEASKLLTYKRDVKFMNAAFALPETVGLLIVRHGAARKRSSFKGDDTDRPLAARGRRQSKRLVSLLNAYGVAKLFSSPATRCLETVEPYADSSGAKIKREVAFGEENHQRKPAAALRRAKSLSRNRASIAVCSHRPVLPDILTAVTLLSGSESRLTKTPLRPASVIVAHRAKIKGDWTVIGIERHDLE